jgi:hypothetical protein
MFPSFPNLAEAIAAERAADFQRDAAQFRRAEFRRAEPRRARQRRADVRRARDRRAPRVGLPQQTAGRVPAAVASRESCATPRAI